MGGSKYDKLLKNKYLYKYKNSMKYASNAANNGGSYIAGYNYLQDSIIPTYHFQKSLPKLPIPKLTDSCNRYLNALKPLLNSNDFDRVEKLTRAFENGEGVELDKQLRELDSKERHSNYVSEPWFDMYLSSRDSIVLNFNPFIAFVPDEEKTLMKQSVRATNYLISSLRMLKSMRSSKLEPEIFHINPDKSDTILYKRIMRFLPESFAFYGSYMFNAYPLDMSQYYRLFNSTRIPKKGKDILLTDESNENILVIRKGHYYVFPVFDDEGNILKPPTILACMKYINELPLKDVEHPLGVLTSENRDVWALVREKIENLSSINKESLKMIDSALYCIALDDFSSEDYDKLSHNFLYGNPKNRWFDKSFTLILTENSHAAVNFEHSWGDGVAVLRLFTELYKDVNNYEHVTSETNTDNLDINPANVVKKLEFQLDPGIIGSIAEAQQKYDASVGKLKLKNFNLDIFGKKFVKKYNLSPDSLMQAAFQTAFHKIYNSTVPTYESCSTAAFKYGRTETIRSATMHTKNFANQFISKSATNSQLLDILRDCTKVHNQLTKEAAMGQGFDRHLMVMRYYAQKNSGKIPAFYLDPAYQLINHNILSTSTLAHPTILTGGFAPVVPNGFGIGYRILDDTLGACVTSYENRDLNSFVECLVDIFEKFKILLKDSKGKD